MYYIENENSSHDKLEALIWIKCRVGEDVELGRGGRWTYWREQMRCNLLKVLL
jgi:hypothetical protein